MASSRLEKIGTIFTRMPQPNNKKKSSNKFLTEELNNYMSNNISFLQRDNVNSHKKKEKPPNHTELTNITEKEDDPYNLNFGESEVTNDYGSVSKMFGELQASISKKRKMVEDVSEDTIKESQRKLKSLLEKQSGLRRQGNERLLRSLNAIVSQLEADNITLKENEQKMNQLTIAHMKSIQQATAVHTQRLNALKEIQNSYAKQCESMETAHQEQCNAIAEEIATDIKKMQKKLIAEKRRSEMETIRKTIVEGLLTRRAIKPEDRPIWFDIYRAFPPIEEPKFARQKPTTTIKPLFYKEDQQRAKFHALGHGLGTVNMLSQTSEAPTRKLIKQYQKLQAEGVPESQLIKKSVETTKEEQQIENKTNSANSEKSLSSSKIKDLFNE